MDFTTLRRRPRLLFTGAVVAALIAVAAGAALGIVGSDDPVHRAGTDPKIRSEFGRAPLSEAGSSAELMARNAFFMSRRTAGTNPLDATQAGVARAEGEKEAKALRKGTSPSGPTTFDSAWAGIGPNPIVQGLRSPGPNQRFGAMSGRIGALAIRKDGTILLAGAQGGIWKWTGDQATGVGSWTALTDNRSRLRWARSPSRRRTTTSCTAAPVRATCRVTATSATAFSSRPTAATPGRTSPATTSAASRSRASSSTPRTPTTSMPRFFADVAARAA